MSQASAPVEADAGPPEMPSVPPVEWFRKNLFSSTTNTILTIVSVLIAVGAYRGLLNFAFSHERDWVAVRTNLRLLFTQAYPEEQFSRVWVNTAILVVLAGLSIGLWARWGSLPPRRVLSWCLATGGLVAAGIVLTSPAPLTDAAGELMFADDGSLVRQSFVDAMVDRAPYWMIAAVLIGVGWAVWAVLGDERRRSRTVPVLAVVAAATGLVVASTWVVRYGHYAFVEGTFIAEPGQLVAASTRIPWTVMWLFFVGAIAAGVRLRPTLGELGWPRVAVGIAWLAYPFAAYWVVLRDPAIDYGDALTIALPWAVALAVAGAALLWWLSDPTLGEAGRIVAIATLVLPAVAWVSAFFGWWGMPQEVRITLLLMSLAAIAAPMFAGERRKRIRLATAWAAVVAVVFYFATLINSPSTLDTPSDEFLGGFSLTVFISVVTIILSFPLGVLLALARTSRLPLFRVMSTTYIEVVRGVPLITVLIFFAIVVNLFLPSNMEISLVAAATAGMTLFSAAYLAENVRGGLQSVRRGQHEAADAIGLSTAMRTVFVVLPQALRVSIPPLVGQVIATFKETSLLAIIGVFDFLRIANSVIPSQTQFLGAQREGLLFVSAVYWIVAFGVSKYSQRLEKRVGLGER